MGVGDKSAHDLSSSNAMLSSVKSAEDYLSMTKPSITDSGGYVEMQPSLLTSYAPPKSSASCVAPSPVYAVGESSSNNSDLEQSVKDLKLLSPDRTNSPQQSPEPASDHSAGRGSMENLFDPDELEVVKGEKHKGKKKFKKKIKKFFTRHRSVEIPSSKSGKRGSGTDSPTFTSLSSIRKARSLTHVEPLKVTVSDDNNTERELSPPSPSAQSPKPRSGSENDILDAGFPVKRSYTMLTDHITKKYQKKILDKLRPDTATPSGSGMNDNSPLSPVRELPREEDERDAALVRSGGKEIVDLTPPSKMSPPRYRRSLYCDQLKYKLRAALQNIHTPLSLSPIYHQLCVDDDAKCDSRYQLILLIQHALQRSRWRHDVMEIALLAELLKMIEPLPNEL